MFSATSRLRALRRQENGLLRLQIGVACFGNRNDYTLSAFSARAQDIQHLAVLVEGFAGICPADKGFIDAFRPDLLLEREQIRVITPPKKNQKATAGLPQVPVLLKRAAGRVRKIVETVGSHLTERFAVNQIRG